MPRPTQCQLDDDCRLLRKAVRGCEREARELWLRFAPGLTRYARTLVPSEPDAEDVVQSVFCAVLRLSPRRADSVHDVRAYLGASVRRTALNHLRGMRRRRRRHERFSEQRRDALLRLGGLDEARAERPVELERVDAAVASLPRRDQELLVLKHVSGMTFDQISLALSTNRNTVAARYRRAIARLAITLGEPPPATSPAHDTTGDADADDASAVAIASPPPRPSASHAEPSP